MTNHRGHTAIRRVMRSLAAALLFVGFAACATTEPTAPEPAFLEGEMNGTDLSLPGAAGLLLTPGAPDTLVLSGFGMNVGMFLRFAYAGPGTYALGPGAVELMSLVGGDVRTGGYRGSASVDGEIVVTQPGGTGAPILAEFWFDAVHESGEQAFGSVAEFRSGRLATRLSSMTR